MKPPMINTEESTMSNTALGNDLLEMMNAWNVIVDQARATFPNATEDQLFDIAKNAMMHTLRINGGDSNV
jgi:hypothetical protein